MRAALSLLLLFLGIAAPASAEVLIYRGTLRAKNSENTFFFKTAKVFMAYDTENGAIRMIASGKIEKVKSYLYPDAPVQLHGAPLPKGKTAVVLSDAASESSPDETRSRAIHWRGTETILTVRTLPEPETVVFPKVFTGINYSVSTEPGGTEFSEQVQTIRFNKRDSVAANNAGLDLDGVFFAETTRLSQAGYQFVGD